MATISSAAEQKARQLLGNLDLSNYDNEANIANNTYGSNLKTLKTNYDNLIAELNKSKQTNREDFQNSRATVSENAYDRNRNTALNIASRGSGAIMGAQQLGEVQNRMATGREVSGLANTFNNAMDKLNDQQVTDTQQYNQGVENEGNTLASKMADISGRKLSTQQNYNQGVASLAMQIQSEINANARAAASNSSAKADALAQAQREATATAGDVATDSSLDFAAKYSKIKGLLGSVGLDSSDATVRNYIGNGLALTTYGVGSINEALARAKSAWDTAKANSAAAKSKIPGLGSAPTSTVRTSYSTKYNPNKKVR